MTVPFGGPSTAPLAGPSGTGADFLQLHAGDAPPRGRTAWLAARLRAAVVEGRVPPGTRLPSTRHLSRDLGVARGVVVEAYRRLTDEGLLAGSAGAGTRVVGVPARPAPAAAPAAPRGDLVPDQPGPDALPLSAGGTPPGVDVDLSPGLPDLSAFPRAAWLRAERGVLQRTGAASLGYGDPRGHPALRTALAHWLARTRGVVASPDDVVVVAGVAQALMLLSHVLGGPRPAAVAVEDPGSRGARDQLRFWGARTVPVPVDGDGVRPEDLPDGVDAALLTPAHQFPTGVVLSPARRHAVVRWARRSGALVVEDDYDAEHRYDRVPVPAVQALDPDAVLHAGSTSKSLAPGLRLGWCVPPRTLHAPLVSARRAVDLGSPALPQLVLAELLVSGAYDRHLRAVRARQRTRRDAVLRALAEHLPTARVVGVAAGLHVLVELPDGSDDVAVARRAAAAGVLVHPLSWHRVAPGPPGLVIGYAAQPPTRLHDAVARVAAAART